MIVTASEEMPQFMCEQNSQQRGRKRKSCEKSGRVFVEKGEAAKERAKGNGFIVCISEGKLSSRHETGAKSQEEKHEGKKQRFCRRARRNLRVIPLADEIVVPIQAFGQRSGGRVWQWR